MRELFWGNRFCCRGQLKFLRNDYVDTIGVQTEKINWKIALNDKNWFLTHHNQQRKKLLRSKASKQKLCSNRNFTRIPFYQWFSFHSWIVLQCKLRLFALKHWNEIDFYFIILCAFDGKGSFKIMFWEDLETSSVGFSARNNRCERKCHSSATGESACSICICGTES